MRLRAKSNDLVLPVDNRNSLANWTFSFAIASISRTLLARDRLLGRVPRLPPIDPDEISVERLSILSGDTMLDAVLVTPRSRAPQAVVLVCHGIGETVEYWTPVQRLLATNEVASLVFDYSGYGRSPGSATPERCERDAASAFKHLSKFFPEVSVSVLGFSLGSAVAAALLLQLPVHRLVLCAAFTSFRAAAFRTGWPRLLSSLVPDVWHTEEALKRSRAPVLLVHGERDRLFPVQMALDLKRSCAAQLVVVPGLSHDDPYYRPQHAYWKLISDFLLEQPNQRSRRHDASH